MQDLQNFHQEKLLLAYGLSETFCITNTDFIFNIDGKGAIVEYIERPRSIWKRDRLV